MSRNLIFLIGLNLILNTSVWFSAAARGTEGLTVERIFGETSLVATLPEGIEWIGDSKGVSYLEERGQGDERRTYFVMRSVPSGKESVVCIPDTVTVPDDLRETDGDKFSVGSYRWDSQGRRILFTFQGELFTMDRKNGRIRRWTWTAGAETNPEFSPDGEKIAFTRDNDLYVIHLDAGEEIRLTETGCDSVLNGILDWVYMEEVFTRGNTRSFYWAPDSQRLTFLQILESPVPEYPLVDLIDTHPVPEMQRYPKAGDPIPIARVGTVSADGGPVTWAAVDTYDDSYIVRLNWLGDGRAVAIEKLNRAQDNLALMFADAGTGDVNFVFDESDEAWVNLNYLKHFYKSERQFIWGSERSGHQHLYLYNMDGTVIRELTSGNWEVTGLEGVDEKKGRVYFTANKSDLTERQLYEVSDKGGEPKQITPGGGIHRVTMSPDNKYFVDRFYSEKRPTVVSVYDVNGKKRFQVADEMSPELAATEWPLPEFLQFESAAGIEYYCSITKPTGFDPRQKYPVIVYVYGGPHAQIVSRRWSTSNLWHGMMADKGYIIFSLDNRGSYGRGKKWEDPILKQLGRYELEDQLAGMEYLKTLPYVDADRIGIWGWSYGGFMTLSALFKAPDVFKAGVAVAPVTDWHLYDAIYTERYMKHPEDNKEGYEETAPLNFVDGFQGKLLLMHGDADNNVHVQNSIQLAKRLIDAGKDFEFMVYPQKRHGIGGAEARVFLFGKMTEFFDRHLRGE